MKRCKVCGADYGLHHAETNQCPLNGVEETRPGHRQSWAASTYVEDNSSIQEIIASLSKRVGNLESIVDRLVEEQAAHHA